MKYSEEFSSASSEQERARGACDASLQREYYLLMINQAPGPGAVSAQHRAGAYCHSKPSTFAKLNDSQREMGNGKCKCGGCILITVR